LRILRRTLKWLALTVALLIVVSLAWATWKVRRAWPQTAGGIAVPGLGARVSVLRDAWGVPQIYAADEHDLFFAQGYVHAQDRLWQMDFDRRVSNGRLAEILGAGLLDTDRYVLTIGIRRAAQHDLELASPTSRAWLEAYAQGVNAFIASHRGRLPIEFTIFGIEPAPWTPLDTLAWAKMTAYSLSQNASMELLRTRLAARLGAAAAARLTPPYEGPLILPPAALGHPDAPSGAPGAPAAVAPAVPSGAPIAAFGKWPPSRRTPSARAVLATLFGPPSSALGSNAWVVHGSRTASGRPLLANDTHLGLSMPSVWYENGLHGGRFDVVGFSFPGVPFVLVGHNQRIAWGISNLCADVEDVYAETRNPRGQMQGPAGWYDPLVIEETIPVRGARPDILRVTVSRHGPLVNDVEELPAGAPPLALRWSAFDGTRMLDALAALDGAGDWPAFRGALAQFGAPALNFVYADTAGNIGYQATGLIPIRAAGHDGQLPVPGQTAADDWHGYIPWESMPTALNPPAGYIVTANNKVVGEDYPYHIGFDYADPYRAQRLGDLLAAHPHLTIAEARAVQTDTTSLPAAALRPLLLAVAPADDRERRALALVRAWDLRFEPASAGATVYYAWFRQVLRDSVADTVGADFMQSFPGFPVNQAPMYVAQLLAGRRPWFDDRQPPPKESRDELVRRAFHEAVAGLAARLGDDPAEWRWGRLHYAFLAAAPLGNSGIAPLVRLFNGRPEPLAGEAFTVEANSPSPFPMRPYRVNFGVTQRLIVDFQDLSQAQAINSSGQNGELFHAHREDQIPLWARGEYRSQPFSRAAVDAATRETLTLTPR
jgi:penicillin amidase